MYSRKNLENKTKNDLVPKKPECIVHGQSNGVESSSNIIQIDFEKEQNGNVASWWCLKFPEYILAPQVILCVLLSFRTMSEEDSISWSQLTILAVENYMSRRCKNIFTSCSREHKKPNNVSCFTRLSCFYDGKLFIISTLNAKPKGLICFLQSFNPRTTQIFKPVSFSPSWRVASWLLLQPVRFRSWFGAHRCSCPLWQRSCCCKWI